MDTQTYLPSTFGHMLTPPEVTNQDGPIDMWHASSTCDCGYKIQSSKGPQGFADVYLAHLTAAGATCSVCGGLIDHSGICGCDSA